MWNSIKETSLEQFIIDVSISKIYSFIKKIWKLQLKQEN